jgi:S1-C subfamily serine protease
VIRALLCALFLSACTPGYAQRSDTAFAVLTRNGVGLCSSFAVAPHTVVTAAHCVDDDGMFAIVSRELDEHTGHGSAPAEVFAVDKARDLAWLRTAFTFRVFLKTRAPQQYENVNAVSAFYGWKRSPGRVLPGFGLFRDTDVTIQHGWSGSPVVGFDGKAVGVVVQCRGSYVNNHHVCADHDMQFSVLP